MWKFPRQASWQPRTRWASSSGAPILTVLGAKVPRKKMLLGLAVIFTLGNALTALAPTLPIALAGRVLTAFNHGTFFGIGSIIAASLVAKDRQASAIAFMFSGLTMANLVGVPTGTWLAQVYDWRLVFWVIAAIGLITAISVALLVPRIKAGKAIALKTELRAFMDPQVLLAMGITVFGPAAFFTSITYIAPMMIEEAGFSDAGVGAADGPFRFGPGCRELDRWSLRGPFPVWDAVRDPRRAGRRAARLLVGV